MVLHSAVREIWWLSIAGGGAAARYVQLRARRRISRTGRDGILPAFILEEQQQHGYNAHSLVSLAAGADFWCSQNVDGAIIYNEYGKVWLVSGDPIARREDIVALTREFIQAGRDAGRYVAFMPATERFAIDIAALRMRAIKIGAAPYFDLSNWAPRGDRARKVRAGVNQAARAGVVARHVSIVNQSLQNETALLCRQWVEAKACATKFGWLFNLDPFQHAAQKNFFTARDSCGRLVGFLAASPIPQRNGWYLEDVIRLPTAPAGTSELLVVEALKFLKQRGAKLATLGTSPLAADGEIASALDHQHKLAKLVKTTFGSLTVFYNFKGLRRFKAKFAPTWWESEYILFPRELRAPAHVLRAFIQAVVPAGPSKVVAQQVMRGLGLRRAQHRIDTEDWHIGSAPIVGLRSTMLDDKSREQVGDEVARDPQRTDHYLGQFVSAGGTRLHYVSKGAGRPVVFIHGNPGSHLDFSLSLVPDPSRSYRTLAFDRPGHGYSERGSGDSVTVEGQARSILVALAALKVERPLVVGHSWGGAVALAMAVEQPDKISGLVLLAPAAFPSPASNWWTPLVHIPVVSSLIVRALTPLIGRGLIRESLGVAYHPQEIQSQHLQAAESLWMRPQQIRACASDDRYLNASLMRLQSRYAEIRLPVTVVTGDSDRLVDPEHAERLHRTINDSRLVRIADTGHQIPHTRPDVVTDAIAETWQLIDRQPG